MDYLRVTVAIGLRDHTWIERVIEATANNLTDEYLFEQIKEFPESHRGSILNFAVYRLQRNNGLDGLNISHFALLHWEIFEK